MFDVQAEIDGAAVGPRRSRAKKRFRIEMKYRAGVTPMFSRLDEWVDWGPGWSNYATAAQRDQAVVAMNKKPGIFQYRAAPD